MQSSKWVLKIKRGPKGEIVKFKARLVACGYSQPDPGFHNRFAPTMRMSTMRALFVIGSSLKWKITVADVDNAFLHGSLDEPVLLFGSLSLVCRSITPRDDQSAAR